MLKYKLYQDNRSNAQHKGNWYAHMNLDGTMGLDELAAHMSDHGTPYSKGVICGVLNDMVGCIKELVLEGNAVKLDNLAIFSVGIESKPANTKEEFNARTHITGYKLRARATGGSINARLSQLASIRWASTAMTRQRRQRTARTPITANDDTGGDAAGQASWMT